MDEGKGFGQVEVDVLVRQDDARRVELGNVVEGTVADDEVCIHEKAADRVGPEDERVFAGDLFRRDVIDFHRFIPAFRVEGLEIAVHEDVAAAVHDGQLDDFGVGREARRLQVQRQDARRVEAADGLFNLW